MRGSKQWVAMIVQLSAEDIFSVIVVMDNLVSVVVWVLPREGCVE